MEFNVLVGDTTQKDCTESNYNKHIDSRDSGVDTRIIFP